MAANTCQKLARCRAPSGLWRPPDATRSKSNEQTSTKPLASKHQTQIQLILATCLGAILLLITCSLPHKTLAQSLSIQPTDFERFIMPCYMGGGPFSTNGPASFRSNQPQGGASEPVYGASGGTRLGSAQVSSGYQSPAYYGGGADQSTGQTTGGRSLAAGSSSTYLGSNGVGSQSNGLNSNPLNVQARDSLTNNLGQSMPRANTIENFIALVSKIELANPRLANNPDQLIRSLLARFRLDNYYYDVRARTPISEADRRVTDILPALMNSQGRVEAQTRGGVSSDGYSGAFSSPIDQALDQDEKCSMYFMLSHFVDKSASSSTGPALGQMPVVQLAGPMLGQRPPSLQAAGTGYPANSANLAYSSGGGGGGGAGSSSGQRYPGPSPSFGSPLTSQMTGFGAGISNTNAELAGQRSPYGVNSPQLTNSQYNSALTSQQLRNPQASFPNGPQARPPFIDAGGSSLSNRNQRPYNQAMGDDRLASEYGVVTISNQDNSAIVLNRVLLGLLAATTPPQTIRQLAPILFPTQDLTSTPRLDEELDPLFAVTLADLWAISSIPKAGSKQILLGDPGRWNNLMCPTSFALERSNSIRFTTAELLGGLDGLNLGMFRRRLLSMRRQLRLSELLRIYYSRTGFKPQYPDIGVCQRSTVINTQLDELRRQSENYLRLYQLNLPTSDQEIALQIARLDGFREFAHRAAGSQLDICQQLGGDSDLFVDSADNCELSRADIVAVLDGSPQANKPFMQLVTLKLAQRVGLSRQSNSLTIMTNQQDSTGFAGAYNFNTIVRNSTNLGEIGCALLYDTSSSYQGGQVTDATKMMEMFERALVNLDSEYLTRQLATGSYSWAGTRQSSSYVSSWFGSGESSYVPSQPYSIGGGGGPRNTGGAKVILWFNYGSQTKPSRSSSGPTNWNPNYLQSTSYGEQQEYKFYEAKKYLRENFRGASILALTPNRDDAKAFVYDEEHDILTDVAAPGDGMSSLAGGTDAYNSPLLTSSSSQSDQALDSSTFMALGGQAEQLVSKLTRRMCSVPAIFQYPMCFRGPSDNALSVGYISPGRRQYWMMSPKTFFASESIRLVFKVDGGRLRVCFGRKPNPDETAYRNERQNGYQQPQQAITFQQSTSGQPQTSTEPPKPSSSDYYTGLEYGVCKDVGQNQEIDFLISDPCYKKSIAECEPFYFVIRELSQPGEGDPNYMCRDDGCKRIDQTKFILAHTGVTCNSALRGLQANWFLIMISTIAASIFSLQATNKSRTGHRSKSLFRSFYSYICLALLVVYLAVLQQVAEAQQGTTYDFGYGPEGQRRGSFSPSEWAAIVLIVMFILGGLALTVALCYYVTKRAQRGMQPVSQEDY